MTTEEFIKKVNALSEDERGGVKATLSITGEPTIETSFTPMHEMNPRLLAYLPRYTKSWKFLEDSTIPGCVLKLMAKLANSKYLEKRYVILNAMPVYEEHFIWHFFRIGEDGEYLKACTTNDPAILINSAYTLDELEYKKAWLPKLWRNAIDSMLTPLELALEGKTNDHME